MEKSEIITYEFTYCENFWNNCGKCSCDVCENICIVFNYTFSIIFSIICCPLCFPLGFLEGACSLPCSSAEKYPAGKWNDDCVKKEYCAIGRSDPFDTLLANSKPSANIGRNFGSLIHPYRFHRCINSVRDTPKTEVME